MAKKTFNFTQARIRDLSLPEKGRDEYYDKEKPKLMCRVSSSGHKTFNVVKWVNGKTQRITIGTTDEITVDHARKQTDTILAAINSGINPVDQKRKEKLGKTILHDVLEQYLADRQLKPLTVKDYRYKLKLGFEDWLKKPVNSITENMVLTRHKKISQTGKTTANTAMRVLRLTLNYACAVGMIDTNPTKILSKARLWHKNARKDRVIPSDKLKAWHNAVDGLSNEKAKTYLFMTLYMGLRSNEALTLEWAHIDLRKKSITIYDTKNGTDHKLPIPLPLLPYIKNLKTITNKSKWVFPCKQPVNPSAEKLKLDRHMAVPTKPIRAVTKACGVEFSSHDCRRTFATIAEAVNLPLTMIKRLMNHVTTSDVTGGYIITEEETLRAAINKIASFITAKVSSDGNVIKLNIVR